MKDIDQKDAPEVSGGYVPVPGTDDCFPWPPEPEYPPNPFDPTVDPMNRT